MRQVVPEVPICWSGDYAPFSVIGDEKWSDTVVSAEVLIEVWDVLLGDQSGDGCRRRERRMLERDAASAASRAVCS